MNGIDIRSLANRLETIETIALIRKVISTNMIGRQVMVECVESDLPLPRALIIAREQTGGRGRGERTWLSPAYGGIYATILHSRPSSLVALFPLEIAVAVATFLRDTWRIDAKLKWPNDVFVDGRKIAGILIEGRGHDGESYLVVGIGINIEPVEPAEGANPISVAEAASQGAVDLDSATVAFAEFFDAWLARPRDRETVLEEWRRLSLHAKGDRIECVVEGKTVEGRWDGIDEHGRAILKQGASSVTIAAGDLIPRSERSPSDDEQTTS